ncbi:MAG: nucleotidyltransferase domain-containing protein [Polyangiales bacterium]
MKVSDAVQAKLDTLVTALKKEMGDDLVSVLVHGSAARGGWREGSDVDLVIVLKKCERERLEAVANSIQGARWSSRIESMILIENEIVRAADVFPVFYDDIKRHHKVIYGSDPFEGLKIERNHLRLRIEQELREAQIRLRRAMVDALGSSDAVRGVVARKIKQVRSPLRSLLALKDKPPADDELSTVLKAAGEAFSIDIQPLLQVVEEPRPAHDALVKLLHAAIEDVDRMESVP